MIAPRFPSDGDPASLNLDAQRAQIAVRQAEAERKQLEELFAQQAVPERRVIDARRQEEARSDVRGRTKPARDELLARAAWGFYHVLPRQ